MSKFFINRPIVAMVIAILTLIVGVISIIRLPVSQFPNIVPPEAKIQATFVGADAQTLAQSVATPIEEQMSGVDNMNYMYSVNATANGQMTMTVDFGVETDPNTDLILTQMRETQAAPQLPVDRRAIWRLRPEIDHRPDDAGGALFTERHLQCPVPRELRIHQSLRPDHPASAESPTCRFSARASTRCASGSSPTCWPSSASRCPTSSTRSNRKTR